MADLRRILDAKTPKVFPQTLKGKSRSPPFRRTIQDNNGLRNYYQHALNDALWFPYAHSSIDERWDRPYLPSHTPNGNEFEMKTICSLLLAFLSVGTLSTFAGEQLWMNTRGKTMFGTLVSADQTNATIRNSDGKDVNILISHLDETGRDAVAAFKKAQAAANATKPAFVPQTATPVPKTAKPKPAKRTCRTCPLRK